MLRKIVAVYDALHAILGFVRIVCLLTIIGAGGAISYGLVTGSVAIVLSSIGVMIMALLIGAFAT